MDKGIAVGNVLVSKKNIVNMNDGYLVLPTMQSSTEHIPKTIV